MVALEATAQTSQAEIANIVRELEEEIALGILVPRQRLVEDELLKRFGVKRHVIRQVLVELETMGIVVRQPNKGAAVRAFSPKEVNDLYEVRELIERRAAELIPLPMPARILNQLKKIHARHSAAVEKSDIRVVFRENLQFHRTLFNACGNIALVEVIEQLQYRTHGIRSYSVANAELLRKASTQHAEMIRAIEDQDRPRLIRSVVAHIQPAKEAYLKLTRHLSLQDA